MDENVMMTINEVADYLEVAQEDVERFVESGELPAFRLGGTLLRFKREHVYSFRRKLYSEKMVRDALSAKRHATFADRTIPARVRYEHPRELKYSFIERLEDFLYYNDFYMISAILLVLIALAFFWL